MAKESILAYIIMQEYRKIRKRYCADCIHLKEGTCELKRNLKECYRNNEKELGGNDNES